MPEFPDSREITLADKPLFDSIFAANPPEVSAYAFTNIFAWREAYGSTVSRVGNHLLVLCTICDQLACLEPLPLVPEHRASLPQVAKDISLGGVTFHRLSAEAAAVFERAGYHVEADRDNWDYLYSSDDLITLAGRKFDGKRNQIAKAKSLIDYDYIAMDAQLAGHCEDFAHRWCEQRDCETVEGLRREKCAVYQMLTNFEALGIVGGAIVSEGEIVAFSLGEALNLETLVVHVEKAESRIDGLYQLINQEFCAAEARRYLYVNREQDLGIAGLRKAKESYHPLRMIETFTARMA